jgi:hypothetical protein
VTATDSPQTNNNLVVVGENGEPYTLLQRSFDNGIETLLLGRSDGSQITLPLTDLSWKGAGTWLLTDAVRVEHVPINQVVTGAVPQVREEGDVTVIPILEERVVTRTELVLVEEVRIHREHSEYHNPQRVTLRKEVVAVERFGEDGRPLPA